MSASMVDGRAYYFNITGMDGVVANGADAVKEIYRTLAETQTCVMQGFERARQDSNL